MPYRLVARLPKGTERFLLRAGVNLVGSAREADVRLRHPTVSRRHARLLVGEAGVTIEDLGSANGTFVSARRVTHAEVVPGKTLRLGQVRAALEELAAEDAEVALSLDDERRTMEAPPTAGHGSTASVDPVHALLAEHLPALLHALAEDVGPAAMASRVGAALYATLPAAGVRVSVDGGRSIAFEARFEGELPEPPTVEELQDGPVMLWVSLARPGHADAYRPAMGTALALLGLALRRAPALAPAASPADPPPIPDPHTLVPRMRRIYEDAARVARGDVGVLILGESGTGKEVLARYVHRASPRADGPFVALNCAALPRDLLESELFGIERGVATGVEPRPGKFELADQGTLFLDEVGDMAPETQARMLRVLQEREVYRLGGQRPRPARIRVIAATNRDVDRLLAEGRFREDLYHRVATWVVRLPPLRERRADIANLAAHFLSAHARLRGRHVGGVSRGALRALTDYRWPGNVRQLENEMSRAALFLEDGEALDTARLSPEILKGAAAPRGGTLLQVLEAAERDAIATALAEAGGDVPRAASRLGTSRATLYRRMKALAIGPAAEA